MARNFKLDGNTVAKFAQIEKILPRIMSHMSTKTFGVIPSSVITSYSAIIKSEDYIFNGAMFAGNVKKVLIKIGLIEGNEKPKYVIRLESANRQQKFMAETKRLNHIMEVNVEVSDGDVLSIIQINPDVVLHSVYISALIDLKQDHNTIKEFVTEQLMETIENEKI